MCACHRPQHATVSVRTYPNLLSRGAAIWCLSSTHLQKQLRRGLFGRGPLEVPQRRRHALVRLEQVLRGDAFNSTPARVSTKPSRPIQAPATTPSPHCRVRLRARQVRVGSVSPSLCLSLCVSLTVPLSLCLPHCASLSLTRRGGERTFATCLRRLIWTACDPRRLRRGERSEDCAATSASNDRRNASTWNRAELRV